MAVGPSLDRLTVKQYGDVIQPVLLAINPHARIRWSLVVNIGLIGTGDIGSTIVPHLVAADHRVEAWSRGAAVFEALESDGAPKSPATAFQTDVVLTALSDDAMRSVLIDSSALSRANKDCVHVAMSTISMKLVDQLQEPHRGAGFTYVAAPVFGVSTVPAKATECSGRDSLTWRRSPARK